MAIINTLPYNLTNGTLADASQVMANFNQIVNNVNDVNAGAAGVNLANTFQQYQFFEVGFKAGSTGQLQADASGNITTSANITLNASILTLAGSSYTNTFNADGTFTLNGTGTVNGAMNFTGSCTFVNPTLNQNPVTLAYANTTYSPLASPTFTGTVTIPTLHVSTAATFTGTVSGGVGGMETIMLSTPVELVSSYVANTYTGVSITSQAPNAKIAILLVYSNCNTATGDSINLRQTGSGSVTIGNHIVSNPGSATIYAQAHVPLNTSQSFDYYSSSGSAYDLGSIWLLGWIQ